MSFSKQKYDDKKDFLAGLTEKEFYERLHFMRAHPGGGRWHK